jgi:hypothetical protein
MERTATPQASAVSRMAQAGCLFSALDRTFKIQLARFRIGFTELAGLLLNRMIAARWFDRFKSKTGARRAFFRPFIPLERSR